MSGGNVCRCEESNKPMKDRQWFVYRRKCNFSHFESPKGGYHYSNYSSVHCAKCDAMWRTKAKYVNELKDGGLD